MPEPGKPDTKAFSQLNFKELVVNIELTDFKLKRTDENAFGHHHEMMNVWQIKDELDSLNKKMESKYVGLNNQAQSYFFYRTSNFIRKPIDYIFNRPAQKIKSKTLVFPRKPSLSSNTCGYLKT